MSISRSELEALTVADAQFKLVTPCLHVALYTDTDFSKMPEQVLAVYERYLGLCPSNTLRWYATENMTRHKPATPRVLGMLPGWLKPGAPPRKQLYIQLKSGADDIDTPDWAFEIDGVEPGGFWYSIRPNMIACSFPADPSKAAIEAFSGFVSWLFESCPFRWGYAGYALRCSPYNRLAAHAAAWRLSMQHPGLDIVTATTDIVQVRREGIKNVNWMTMLGPDFVERLGGAVALREQLPPDIDLRPIRQGIAIQTGPAPELGHVNRQELLPAYRAVYKVLEPLQRHAVEAFTSFSLVGADKREQTQAWLRRFSADDHA